ncbi:MAG: hypothetical protein AB9836_09155 [Aminipila sp.]
MRKTKILMMATLISTLILSMAFPLTVSADTDYSSEFNNQTIEDSADSNVIHFDSTNEMQAFVQDLEEHNNRVEKKWAEALKKATQVSPVLQANQEINQKAPLLKSNQLARIRSTTSSYSQTAEISKKWREFIGTNYFYGYMNLRGQTITDKYTRFQSCSGVYFKSQDTKNKVENHTYQVALSDSNRTYVVKSDSFVTIDQGNGNSKRYPLSLYVEFYASGGSYVAK